MVALDNQKIGLFLCLGCYAAKSQSHERINCFHSWLELSLSLIHIYFIFPAEYETDDAFLFLVLLVFMRVNQCAKYHLCQAGGICADGL